MTSALSHIRVLDLSRSAGYPGGYLTELLVDLGAEVVKVEPPGRGDPLRMNWAGEGIAAAHVGLNRGKRSMTLDTRSPASAEVLERLIVGFDVVVETNKPGAAIAPGFDYDRASSLNQGLIWCSLTGFGQDGPYAQRPGHDLSYLAQSGLLASIDPSNTWLPNGMLGVPLGAMAAVLGILAALEARHVTGRGARVDTSIAESATWLLSGMPGVLSGQPMVIPFTADRRLYRCADGKLVSVAAAEPKTWAVLCEGLGLPELSDKLHVPEPENSAVAAQVAARFAERPAADWVELLGAAGAAVGPVNSGTDIVNDPHNRSRGVTVEVAGMPVPAGPVHVYDPAGTPITPTVTAPPPELGADTVEQLAAAGYTPEQIAELRAAGVV